MRYSFCRAFFLLFIRFQNFSYLYSSLSLRKRHKTKSEIKLFRLCRRTKRRVYINTQAWRRCARWVIFSDFSSFPIDLVLIASLTLKFLTFMILVNMNTVNFSLRPIALTILRIVLPQFYLNH